MRKDLFHILKVTTAGFLLTLGVSYLFAQEWVPPTTPPPACNPGDPGCSPPVHIGSAFQKKTGGFRTGQLFSAGWFQLNSKNFQRDITDGVSAGDDRSAVVFGSGDDPHSWYLGAVTTNANNAVNHLGLWKWGTGWVQTWLANGNVGIGTTTPGATLDVSGTLRIQDGSERAGRVLTSDSTGLASWQPSVGFTKISVFRLNGTYTWTAPSGVTKIMVEVWGGGGNGVTLVTVTEKASHGGSGGGYGLGIFTVTPGASYTVEVGRGGGWGGVSGPGGTSSFALSTTPSTPLISATGGAPSSSYGAGGRGLGGKGIGGNISIMGEVGGFVKGSLTSEFPFAHGGAAPRGGGGGFGFLYGINPGGGGGGGSDTSIGVSAGYGGDGQVIVWW